MLLGMHFYFLAYQQLDQLFQENNFKLIRPFLISMEFNFVTGQMVILGGSVRPGTNVIGRMESGMNTNIYRNENYILDSTYEKVIRADFYLYFY